MENKLQELTDKLYSEGLAKGKEAGDKYLSDAKLQAEQIIADAKQQAEQIIANARQQASELEDKAKSDLKMASSQSLQATKKDIEDLLLKSLVNAQVAKNLSDCDFLKEIILAVAKGFSTQQSSDIALVLPATLKEKLEAWVSGELSKTLSHGVKAEFSKKIGSGFNIGPADGSWFISLTDETFNELISEYLRPVTKKLLFGE